MTKKILFFLLLGLNLNAAEDKDKTFKFTVEAVNKSYSSQLEDKLNLSSSSMAIRYSKGTIHLEDMIRKFGGNVACTDVYSVKLRLSSLIHIKGHDIKKSAKESLARTVDLVAAVKGPQALADKRAEVQAGINAQLELVVDGFIQQEGGHYTEADRAALAENFRPMVEEGVAGAAGFSNLTELDAFIVEAVKLRTQEERDSAFYTHKKELERRLDYEKFETTVRGLVFGMGKCFAGGKIFGFASIGKDYIEGTAEGKTLAGDTELDELRPVKSVTQAGMGSMAAGNVKTGFIYKLEEGGIIRVDFTLFKTRIAGHDATNYLAKLLNTNTMSNNAYDEHKRFWEIDSQLVRLLFKSNQNMDVYFAVGNYDGKSAFAAGTIIKITPLNQFEFLKESETKLLVDYVRTSRSELRKGYSAFLKHTRTDGFIPYTLYLGYEYAQASTFHGAKTAPADTRDLIVGANGTLYEGKLFDPSIWVVLTAYIEGVNRSITNSKHHFAHEKPEENGVRFNLGANIELSFPGASKR